MASRRCLKWFIFLNWRLLFHLGGLRIPNIEKHKIEKRRLEAMIQCHIFLLFIVKCYQIKVTIFLRLLLQSKAEWCCYFISLWIYIPLKWITGLHVKRVYTNTGTSSPQFFYNCNVYEHTTKELVYALRRGSKWCVHWGEEVPVLVYTLLMCKPVKYRNYRCFEILMCIGH